MTTSASTRDASATRIQPPTPPALGVVIAGTGCHYPERKLTNKDLESFMDTSDEWITQRTGIRERRICDPRKGESVISLCTEALKRALDDAKMNVNDLDLLIVGTVTGEMTCPSTACRVLANLGSKTTAGFDILAACCGFVYGLNTAYDMIRVGTYKNVGVVGCDVMTRVVDYGNRSISILFGDAAGAAILSATDDTSRGRLAGGLHADGSRWHDLYIPRSEFDYPEGVERTTTSTSSLQMNGREVYRFAVGTFSTLIGDTLEQAGLKVSDIDMFVCHQSNARMLESARSRLGIPEEKMYINIDRFGNCSAGSVPLCLDELRKQGKCQEGDRVMFVAFGGGLTWGSSLWRL